MKKARTRFTDFINSGYDEAVYNKYREEIIVQNNRNVRTTSFIGSIIMTMLTITSLFIDSVSKVLPLYFTTAIMFIAIYVVTRIEKLWINRKTLLCNYVFLAAAFFFAIGLDIIQRNDTATTICVLLVALPLLIVDKPYREFTFFLIISMIFMYETQYIKQSPKASIDVLNSASFLIVGTFLGYKHNQMVLRNISGHDMLKRERDTDSLTNLYNKGALEDRAVGFLSKTSAKASMILIDMDNFKSVNDTYGHHSGDEILKSFADLMKSIFRESDLISRFGGDEFIVFMPNVNEREVIKQRASRLLEGVKDIRIKADSEYRAHICIGISTYPDDGSDYEELFKNADKAMYTVKNNGKNGYAFYDKDIKKKILIVDDIEVNRAVVTQALIKDFDIIQACDGKEAINILEKEKDISLVITDIQMPNMDGIELIKNIKANEKWNDIAIIANTQYGDQEQEEEIFNLGVDDFIYKAISPKIIIIRVKNVLTAKG